MLLPLANKGELNSQTGKGDGSVGEKVGDLAICDPAQAHATYQLRVPLRLLILPGSDIAISKTISKSYCKKKESVEVFEIPFPLVPR
jgi:hypothetical protein